MASGYGIELFGYQRARVNKKIKNLERSLKEALANSEALEKSLQDLSLEVKSLRAEKEEYRAALMSLKRQQMVVTSEHRATIPMTVMVGPADTMSLVTGIMDALDNCTFFTVRFRLFRDGYYRADGVAADPVSLVTWLQKRPDVQLVDHDKGTIHVIPKEIVD
jgi:regulator of replication initiation timing